MLLAIDSGNSNIVFAIFDKIGNMKGRWTTSSDYNKTADELGIWLTQLMDLTNINKEEISNSIIASVVPGTLFSLKILCQKYFKSNPIVVGETNIDLGINICVDVPNEVGSDRIVNAIAAQDYYKPPLIIVDFGTATTFDIINQKGGYEGGLIAPGINLSLEALHRNAALLPRIAVEKPLSLIGKNTIDAMKSGIFWGYIGLIEGIIFRLQKELKSKKLRVIATGGLSTLFTQHCSLIEKSEINLTLLGLFSIYQRNKNCL